MNIETPRKKHDLASAIAEGDIRVLLMVLVHMTGDERWLEPPYKPRRDVRLIPDPEAGLPKEIQDEVKEFWRPEYDQIGTKWKVSPPLGVTELSYAMERWDREVGADQVKK